MRTKSLNLIGLLALAAAALHGQPTTGPVFWSTNSALDCSSLGESAPVAIPNAVGNTIGYSCYTSGTFVWFAAGGGWSTAIRVAAPASNPVWVDYTFYDTNGNNLAVDTTASLTVASAATNDVNFALAANQPAEIDLLGATGNGPGYANTTVGSAYVVIYCPDANTCINVLPQLLYSNLPNKPWLLSVPIILDNFVSTQWSAEGIDDGGTHEVSFVVYNEDLTATAYTLNVYNSAGTLVGTGTTPSILPLASLGNGNYGQGGTYGAQLRAVVPNLPTGPFKVLFQSTSGTLLSAVEVLQFDGPSASSLQVAFDSAPGSTTGPTLRPAAAARQSVVRSRIESMPKPGFGPAPK